MVTLHSSARRAMRYFIILNILLVVILPGLTMGTPTPGRDSPLGSGHELHFTNGSHLPPNCTDAASGFIGQEHPPNSTDPKYHNCTLQHHHHHHHYSKATKTSLDLGSDLGAPLEGSLRNGSLADSTTDGLHQPDGHGSNTDAGATEVAGGQEASSRDGGVTSEADMLTITIYLALAGAVFAALLNVS